MIMIITIKLSNFIQWRKNYSDYSINRKILWDVHEINETRDFFTLKNQFAGNFQKSLNS